ncbi:MAG: hypothetical protein DSY77_12985 [Bacteroidetes bacterium]|nr:MAG: hypothetical protein DSY77_12985 [Bacteroidota bacterium]
MKTILALSAIVLLFSCSDDNVKPPFNNQEFYENHEAANWTKETAKEHLQGRWKLIYTYCCPMSPNSGWTAVEDDYFELQFENDSVKVFENNVLAQTQYWEFDERYEGAFYLETAEPISNTFGTLYFSENHMFFNASPFDGPDNYFEKVD